MDLDWESHVEFDESLKRPADVKVLTGDAGKAESALGWKPRTRFQKLVRIMVEEDLKRV